MRRAGFAVLVASFLVGRGGGVVSCDTGGTECQCPSTGLTIHLPAAVAGKVVSVETSGLACKGAVIQPDPATSRVTELHVAPTEPGQCHLEILFATGTTFSDDVTVVETPGCCAGLRTDPLGAASIDVPGPDGGA